MSRPVNRPCVSDRWLAVIACVLLGQGQATCGQQPPLRPAAKPGPVLFRPLTDKASEGSAGLFVGVNTFPEDPSLNALQFAVHDAIELAYLFVVELRLVPAPQCHLLLSGTPSAESVKKHLAQLRGEGVKVAEATRTKILSGLMEVCEKARLPSDVLVVGLSSHGFEVEQTPCVMPCDGMRKLTLNAAVSLRKVRDDLQRSKAGHRLLLVDACHERISARNVEREPAGATMAQSWNDAFRAILNAPTGQAAFVSCSPGEQSHELSSLGGVGHGVFTYAVLSALRGEAQSDAENVVRLCNVADCVAQHMTGWTKKHGWKQTPWLEGSLPTKHLPLARRAEDIEILRAAVQKRPLSARFTKALQTQLLTFLGALDLKQEEHRALVARTRDFLDGALGEDLFVPYLVGALETLRRRNGADTPLLRAPCPPAEVARVRDAWSRARNLPAEVTNSIRMKLALVPPGEFGMGTDAAAVGFLKDRRLNDFQDESPRHKVRLPRPFYIGVHEVTIGQFRQFVDEKGYRPDAERIGRGGNGWNQGTRQLEQRQAKYSWKCTGWDVTDDHPVVNVTWDDAMAFCEWLSKKEGVTYRLPSEAEWEYAARAGTETLYPGGNGPEGLVLVGNVADQTAKDRLGDLIERGHLPLADRYVFTAPVGSFKANAFGLCDMLGNVWEWCSDFYDSGYYVKAEANPQAGPPQGTLRVARGGSFASLPHECRPAFRDRREASNLGCDVGFRVVRVMAEP